MILGLSYISLSFNFLISTWTWTSQVLPCFWGRERHFLVSLPPLLQFHLGSKPFCIVICCPSWLWYRSQVLYHHTLVNSHWMSQFTRSRFTNHIKMHNYLMQIYLIKMHNSFTSSFRIQVGDLSVSTSHPMAPGPLRYDLSLKTWLPNNSFPTVRNRILSPRSHKPRNCSQDAYEAHVSDLMGSFQN